MDAKIVANYLTKLKEKTGLTFEAIAEQSGLSLTTVKNLFSGKSEDPRLNTVAPVTHVLNGSVDEMYTGKSKDTLKEISLNSIKEMYEFQLSEYKATTEAHIANIRAHYEQHRDDVTENYEHRLADKNEIIKEKDKQLNFFKILACGVLAVLVGLLILEVANPSLGWLRF
jgi:transcriptional regulator with XRE-family HTH domain